MARRLPVSLALALTLIFATPAPAAAQCGGLGQVPCYRWDWCAWKLFGVFCMGWWVPTTEWNGCNSSRLNNIGLVCAACGDTGQPECAYDPACNQSPQRHTPFGLCYACGQNAQSACLSKPDCDPGNRSTMGVCWSSGHSEEPTTNSTVVVPTQPAGQPLYGVAELHIHPFANLAFGGATTAGSPYDPRGIDAALAWCDYTRDFATESFKGIRLDTSFTPGYRVHGPWGLHFKNAPMEGSIGLGEHAVAGTGSFEGWPKWNSVTHQQVYYKWLQRAYEGGVRLMVMLAVNNEALCMGSTRRVGWSCNDMWTADRQIAATKELEAAIDQKSGGTGRGWFRIAYSPQQARQIIRSGKLAVILGIEVDSLFNCKPDVTCDDAYLRSQIARYYNMGVRHIYPIHGFDNAFGGAALFNNQYNYGNRLALGRYFDAWDCSTRGFGFNAGPDSTLDFVDFFYFGITDGPPTYPGAAECNARGLTPTGVNLLNALMDAKMIVDIDHMSLLMLEGRHVDTNNDGTLEIDEDGALDIFEERHYPVVSTHASFFELKPAAERAEFHRTEEQLGRIRDLGGIVAPFPPTKKCNTSKDYPAIWRYVESKMSGGAFWPGTDGVIGIGFATDMMGATQETAPRFGPDATGCPDDPATRLVYPFQAQDGSGWFYPQQTGSRIFDFNTNGLAHYGLVPDLLADIRKTANKSWGLESDEMTPIFRSAEAYIRMWERIASGETAPPPTVTAQVTGTQGENGWYTSDVMVRWTIQSDTAITSSTGCGDSTISADTEGTVITCSASNAGGGESEASVTIRRDTTPPTITSVTRLTEANEEGWNNGDVEVRFEATDETSGIAGPSSVTVTVTREGAGQTATYTFLDEAGLSSEASAGGISIDRTPPRIGFRFANLPETATPEENEAEQARWHDSAVTLLVYADDQLSGVASISPEQILLTEEGVAVSGSATATDRAGNSITAGSGPVKIDLTDPTITRVSRTPPNARGWNRSDVTVEWSCGDALSGVVAPIVIRTLSQEGAGLTATGVCVDLAGHEASASETGINIDTTPPAVSFEAPQPPAGPFGWHRDDVGWPFVTSDNLSGVVWVSAASPIVVGGEGDNLTATVAVKDAADNEASFVTPITRIDRTPPAMACAVTPARLWPANHKLVPVDVTVTFTDGLSGTATYSLTAATSSEPDQGTGDGDASGDIQGFVPGQAVVNGALRAERAGGGTGRTYTLRYQGLDRAGNGAVCSTSVLVPHDLANGPAASGKK